MEKNNLLKPLLIFFTITFFLGLTVLLIIITRGGKITPEGIVETGVVHLTIEPADAKINVYLDDTKTSLVENNIKSLDEGNHTLRIESEGYSLWQKEVSVVHGLVTEVFVRLYPTDVSIQQITNSNIDNLFFSPDNDYAYYVVTQSEFGSEKGIWRLQLTESQLFFGENNLEPEKISEITTEIETILADADNSYTMLPSEDNKSFLITTSTSIYLFNVDGNNEPRDITEELSILPQRVTWLDNSNSLLISDTEILYEYNLASKTKTLIHYTQTGGLPHTSNNEVVYFFDREAAQLNKYINTAPTIIAPVNTILPDDIQSLYTAIHSTDIVIAKTQEDYQYINIKKGIVKHITSSDFTFLKMSPTGNSALFMKEDKVYSFILKENLTTNTVHTSFNTIIENFNVTNTLEYTPVGAHIIYYDKNTQVLSILEADGSNVYPIDINGFNIKNNSFRMNSTGESIFLLLSDANEEATTRANIFQIDLVTL